MTPAKTKERRNERSVKCEPRSPLCPSCAQLMRLARITSRFDDLPDLYTFECSACGVSHIEEAPLTARLRVVEPSNENRTVPVRPSNSDLRPREYLTPAEVEKLTKKARDGRYGHRDATLILIAYRHALRAVEICDLEWSQVEFGRAASLHVRRAKNGKPSVHPMRDDEVRALRELRRQFPDSTFVFATERGGPFTPDAVSRLIKRIGARAKLPFPIHVQMLRRAAAYALAGKGHDTRAIQDWLGHRSIQHTVRYTELSQDRFKNFWRD